MMTGRVYPQDTESPPVSGEHMKVSGGGMHRSTLSQDSLMSKDSYAFSGPPSGTYVIQVPKDQIYRVPPPENAHKYKLYTTHQRRRGRCHRCCCAALGILLLLAALFAAAAGVLYLIYRPKPPSFSVERVSVHGVNVTSSAKSASLMVSPAFNVTVRAENPNRKIGIYYELGSSVTVYHHDLKLCDGHLPAFYQKPGNVTVFATDLAGGDIVMSSAARAQLAGKEKKGRVPLTMAVEVPVSVRVGGVRTWKMTAKGECEVALSALTAKAIVVSKKCSLSVKPW